MPRSLVLLAAAAVFATAGANAQDYSTTPTARSAALTSVQSGQPARGSAMNAGMTPSTAIDLRSVSNPDQTLTNLTVYAHGVDIGHVAQVRMDFDGKPERVQIAFNSGMAPVWMNARELRYDAEKRQITADMSASAMQNMSARRIR